MSVPNSRRRSQPGWQLWLLLLVAIVVAIAPMLERSYPIAHSTHFNLSWAFQYQRQFFSGQFYPRWLEFSNFGFGNATFVFYPPLCLVATLPFRALGLGLVGSLIGSMALAIAAFALGLYRCARGFYAPGIAATVAALGIFSPYLTVNIYQRGAIGEVWAIAVLPWLLVAAYRSVRRAEAPRPLAPDWDLLELAIAYSLLVLAHLPSLLLTTLVGLACPVCVAAPKHRGTAIARCGAAVLLAFGLTAFFLLPVLLDGRTVELDALAASPDYLPQNRLMLSGLWQLDPDLTDHWFDRGLRPLWYVFFAMTILGAIGYTLSARWPSVRQRSAASEGRSSRQRLVAYSTGVSAIALLMTTDLLSWLYPLLPPLERIQFSWRWLVLPAAVLPLLLAEVWVGLQRLAPSALGKRLLVGALSGCLWAIVAWHGWESLQIADRAVYAPDTIARFARLAAAKTFPEPAHRPPLEPFLNWHWVSATGLALGDVYEYRAQGVTLAMPPPPTPPIAWDDGSTAGLQRDRWTWGKRQFVATNPEPVSRAVRLRTFDYPAWYVRLDRQSWQRVDRTTSGQMRVWIPPGTHSVTVTYRGTLAERLGTLSSGAVVFATGLAIVADRAKRQRGRSSPTSQR